MKKSVATIAGRYYLLERISEGGQGEVWLAADDHNAKLAVKMLPRPRGSAERESIRKRFQDEIEAGRALHSPHVCRLLDAGELEEVPELHRPSGVFYSVMEYVEGGSLEEFIVAGTEFELDHLRVFVERAAAALQEAHSANPRIVHRDIKPANILLKDGLLTQPKLADFGLARAEGGTRLTATGDSVGTPYYMAPEQVVASSDVTPAADQYAFALLLCEMLTQEVPGASSDFIAVYMQRNKGVDMPEILVEEEAAPNVRAVLQRAISPKPEDRFASMQAFAAAFDQAGIEDGWWDANRESLSSVQLQELSLFVFDQRPNSGKLWVGGLDVDSDLLKSLFSSAKWTLEEEVADLGGASAYTPDREVEWVWNADATKKTPRAVKKKAKRAARPRRRADEPAFMEKLVPSAELARVIGSRPLDRTEVVKKLWAYIKKNGLQDAKNPRMIHADSLLLPVFGGKKTVSMFDMTKLVSKHLASQE
jgi:serine/threonine protein kinase